MKESTLLYLQIHLTHLHKRHGIECTAEKPAKRLEQKEKASFASDGTCKTYGQLREVFNPVY